MTTTIEYQLITEADEHGQRVFAVGADGVEIAGAYRISTLNDWRFYVTRVIAERTGLTRPHKAHACSRADALHWVETIAALYMGGVA